MRLVWRPSFSASCLHAADALRRGLLPGDSPLAALRPAVAQLEAAVGDWARFAAVAVPLAARHDSASDPAEPIASQLGLAGQTVGRLRSALTELEAAARRAAPRLETELSARERPMREQWEARGPGFIGAVAGALPRALPPQAHIYLLHPVRGGAGASYPRHATVAIEGLLYHTTAAPEPVRLGWLLVQLAFDSASDVRSLASLPLVHQAAHEVQWLQQQTLADLLAAWQLCPASEAEPLGDKLQRWWRETVHQPWPKRLDALQTAVGQ